MFKTIFTIFFLSLVTIAPALASETAYERVMRTGVLRCGYFEETPFTMIDANTGKKSGIAVDLVETMAAQSGIKVEWTTAIVNFASMVTDLQEGRYDAVCGSAFNIPRAGKIDYTTPYIYVPSYAVTRVGEKRFDNNLAAIDDPNVKIAVLDGEGSSTVAKRIYPKASQYSLPQASEISQLLLGVSDKKADVGFVIPSLFDQFDKNNPGKLRIVPNSNPFYVFSVSLAIRPNEPALKDMLDIMIKQLVVSGEMDRIIDKYEAKPKTFLRVNKPYRM